MPIYFIILLLFTIPITITLFNEPIVNEGNDTHVPTDKCDCDISDSCDYLCCCDENDCPEEAIQYWKDHLTCIDEKDSVGIFADRCIDNNLIWKYNERRGLKINMQTEDVKKKENTIENWCFSIDNNDIDDLKELEDLSKDFGITYDEQRVFEDYFEKKILKHYFNSHDTETQNNVNKKLIKSNSTSFAKDGNFMLFSGQYCSLMKNVEISKSVNASCTMTETTYIKLFDRITLRDCIAFGNEECCSSQNDYEVNHEGYLSPSKINGNAKIESSSIVLEIEFILKMKNNGIDVESCKYNRVILNVPSPIYNFTFKNSVKFTNDANFNIPYRYSGNVGYLNNLPLKVYFKYKGRNHTSNEFIIVGKNSSNGCRINKNNEDDLLKYLYNVDKPLLFGEEYSYYCNYGGSAIKDTTLYQKIQSIEKIGKYGSSRYTSKSTDWVDVNNDISKCSKINDDEPPEDNTIITLEIDVANIYVKNNIFKTISNANLICEHEDKKEKMLGFKVKYNYNKKENPFTKEPNKPAFVPRLPSDLLDPLKTSDVTK